METLLQILSPDFLLRNSVYTSILVGFACPLVGAFLVLRRLVFMGVALPQISSTGVAVALSAPLWLGVSQAAQGSQNDHAVAFVGSIVFTLGRNSSACVYGTPRPRSFRRPIGNSLCRRRGPQHSDSLQEPVCRTWLARSSQRGSHHYLQFRFALTAIMLALVLAVLALFHKELFLVSFDRVMAVTLRQKRRVLGYSSVPVARHYRVHGGAERWTAYLVRLFIDTGACRASLCAHNAAIPFVRIASGRSCVAARLLDCLQMGLSRWAGGRGVAGGVVRRGLAHRENGRVDGRESSWASP